MIRNRRSDLLILLGLFILPLILFWSVTIGGQTLLPVDNLYQFQPWKSAAEQFSAQVPQNQLLSDLILENYAWKHYIVQSLQQREVPLWNPNLFAGAPFLANGQHSAYYPFSVLFYLLPLTAAYGWFTVSQLFLAGAFMYLLCRVLGLGRLGSQSVGSWLERNAQRFERADEHFLRFFADGPTVHQPSLKVTQSGNEAASKLLRSVDVSGSFVVLHPGSSGSSRPSTEAGGATRSGSCRCATRR